jgi:hypothetical protein
MKISLVITSQKLHENGKIDPANKKLKQAFGGSVRLARIN